MTKTRTFRNTTGSPFTIYTGNSGPSHTIRVEADQDFETDDEQTIEALEGSGRVEEVKTAQKVKEKVQDAVTSDKDDNEDDEDD